MEVMTGRDLWWVLPPLLGAECGASHVLSPENLTSPLFSFPCILIEGTAEEHRAHLLPSTKGRCKHPLTEFGWSRGHGGHTVGGAGEAQCLLPSCLPTEANGGGGGGGGST